MDKKQDIIKEIKHFEYTTGNKYEVVESLIKKNYTEEEIIKGFNDYKFKNNWNGNILGIFMIVLSIFIAISIQSTFGSFNYEFDSRGDFIRLNEWVLKTILYFSFTFIGINILINRGFCNKQSKIIMIVSYSLFLLTSISSHNAFPLLYVPTGIILFSILKISNPSELSNGELILNAVKNGTDKKQALKKSI